MTANNFEILAGVIHRIIKQQHTRPKIPFLLYGRPCMRQITS